MVINVQNKILHNLLPILNTLPNGVIPAARHSKTKKCFFVLLCARVALLCFAKLGDGSAQQNKKMLFCFAMRSPCTTLLRQVRLRLGSKNESFWTFILYFSRLALTLHWNG